jgi:hypothetical protein
MEGPEQVTGEGIAKLQMGRNGPNGDYTLVKDHIFLNRNHG